MHLSGLTTVTYPYALLQYPPGRDLQPLNYPGFRGELCK
jgi:hypothetical protein